MQTQQSLLLNGLDRHKAHVLPTDRFANRFRVARIIFIRLHVRFHDLCGDELHSVAEFAELARPEMRAAAGLHPDQARPQLGEEIHHLRTLQGLAQHRLTLLADPVDLKDILCQIKPNRRNVHRGRSCRFEWLRNTSTLAHLMPCRAGASMPLLIPVSEKPEPPLSSQTLSCHPVDWPASDRTWL